MNKNRRKLARQTRKRWRHRVVHGLLLALREFFSIYPPDVAIGLGGRLGGLAAHVLREQRRVALRNLELAFGDEKSPAERRRIVREMFANAGRSAVELLISGSWGAHEIGRRVSADQPQRLVELCSGRGAMLITGHFGNWELIPGYVAQVLGLGMAAIARDLHNPAVEQLLYEWREAKGCRVLARGRAGRELVRVFEDNAVMGIVADQDSRRTPGIFVEFFGRPAYTPLGVYELAALGRTRVLCAFMVRQPDGLGHRLYFGEEIPVPRGGDRQENARAFTSAYTREIEKFVRRYPEQWMWFHRRWKRQPRPAGESQTDEPRSKGDPFIKSDYYS
ncbi:lysophospholipid acyltransferase family protein [Candidatus Sumerlaeota bacterium]